MKYQKIIKLLDNRKDFGIELLFLLTEHINNTFENGWLYIEMLFNNPNNYIEDVEVKNDYNGLLEIENRELVTLNDVYRLFLNQTYEEGFIKLDNVFNNASYTSYHMENDLISEITKLILPIVENMRLIFDENDYENDDEHEEYYIVKIIEFKSYLKKCNEENTDIQPKQQPEQQPAQQPEHQPAQQPEQQPAQQPEQQPEQPNQSHDKQVSVEKPAKIQQKKRKRLTTNEISSSKLQKQISNLEKQNAAQEKIIKSFENKFSELEKKINKKSTIDFSDIEEQIKDQIEENIEDTMSDIKDRLKFMDDIEDSPEQFKLKMDLVNDYILKMKDNYDKSQQSHQNLVKQRNSSRSNLKISDEKFRFLCEEKTQSISDTYDEIYEKKQSYLLGIDMFYNEQKQNLENHISTFKQNIEKEQSEFSNEIQVSKSKLIDIQNESSSIVQQFQNTKDDINEKVRSMNEYISTFFQRMSVAFNTITLN